MDRNVTLILLFFGLSLGSGSHFPLREYYYVDLEMSWTDAQSHCRMYYGDLATFESADDQSRLQPTFSYSWAWIGLHDDPKSWKENMGSDANSWRWSSTNETSKTGYKNWNLKEPANNKGKESCAITNYRGLWYDAPCQSVWTFVCYTEINQTEKTYVFISSKKTWYGALNYCRKHYTDLPVIESREENNEVISVMPHLADSWIGLYRVPWTWSDKTQSSFKAWKSWSPDNSRGDEFCVAENPKHEWKDSKCQLKKPFICHRVLKLKTTVKLMLETDADMTDPATNTQILQQLDAVLKSQGWTDFKLQWTIQPTKQKKLIE